MLADLLAALLIAVPLAMVVAGGRAYDNGPARRARRAGVPASGRSHRGGRRIRLRVQGLPGGAGARNLDRARQGAARRHDHRADASGRPAGGPLQSGNVISVVVAAVIAVAVAGSVLRGFSRRSRWVLFRRRLAAWGAGWQTVGLQWTSLR